jgi:hypothetical protein
MIITYKMDDSNEDDLSNIELHAHALDYYLACFDVLTKIRNRTKYKDDNVDEYAFLDELRECIMSRDCPNLI